jgi:hypothetical protein
VFARHPPVAFSARPAPPAPRHAAHGLPRSHHGARAVVRVSRHRPGKLWSWIEALLARRPFNVVVAGVANKLARIIWVLLSRGEAYRAA